MAKIHTLKKKKQTLADLADRHDCYQKSVQAPDFELEFFEQRYRQFSRKKPLILREDFCGTALAAVEWCKTDKERKAIGVDLCADTLAWARENNLKTAGKSVAQRVMLLNENVLDVETPAADIICAMNFSYCIFETRELLLKYFNNVRRSLNKKGVFFMDLLGGTATIDEVYEEREIEDENFTYIWEQTSFNPITNHVHCYIHFEFDDGSTIDRAFEYSWRLWSIPEIKELLLEAGFSKVHVFWEKFIEDEDDPDSEYLIGSGEYDEVTEVDQQESWLAYFVVER